jgi:group I intron endonuclease
MENCGVYAIVNKVNSKRYVGSSHNIEVRWRQHRNRLRCGKHVNCHLQMAWNKYGESNFEFIVLLECEPDELIEIEQCHMDNLLPEYNLLPFAIGVIGYKYSPETCAKLSAIRKGKPGHPNTQETKDKISAKLMGHPVSKETIEKWASKQRGIKQSEERKQTTSEAMKLYFARQREETGCSRPSRKQTPEHVQHIIDGRKRAKERREQE